jgi:enoyl-CoA hydratase
MLAAIPAATAKIVALIRLASLIPLLSLDSHPHTICFRTPRTDHGGGGMAELATYELDGSIATITMDDGKVNALSVEMLKAVMAALDRAEQDAAVVVLTGREKYFSAGFDLKVFSERPDEIVEMLTLGARLSERLLSFPTPVLAACNGHAIAAGTFPLLAADLRIGVAGDHRLGLNEVRIGLTVPLYVVELARQRLTPRDFNRSLVTAHLYDPEEAAGAGLLDRVVAAEELRDASLEAAGELAGLNMDAHAATKKRVRDGAIQALREAVDAELAGLPQP